MLILCALALWRRDADPKFEGDRSAVQPQYGKLAKGNRQDCRMGSSGQARKAKPHKLRFRVNAGVVDRRWRFCCSM
ncbi:MAG: hypothetical protein CBC55_07535 [Gammaproteobacteria bacterium TMED95]|nr:hypothetical protein [Gammaproteobacteria bacterium]OUV20824.1 MAG: hypothetical protein CBC55_07535 [Gammaproteobacteria bacterium TMED95]